MTRNLSDLAEFGSIFDQQLMAAIAAQEPRAAARLLVELRAGNFEVEVSDTKINHRADRWSRRAGGAAVQAAGRCSTQLTCRSVFQSATLNPLETEVHGAAHRLTRGPRPERRGGPARARSPGG